MYITDYNVNEISECKSFDKMIRLVFLKKVSIKNRCNYLYNQNYKEIRFNIP